MRRALLVAAAAIALVGLPACGGNSSSSSGGTRTVLTDYNSDQFANSVFAFLPKRVPAHPGDTIDFKQAWTGEPHTVTMGQLAEPLGKAVLPYLDAPKLPDDEPKEVLDAEQKLPEFFTGGSGPNQTAAQPCFLDKGPIPSDEKPCPQLKVQPAFYGRQAFYSSGFIKYGGNTGNHYEVKLASNTAPGDYFFFCLVHGSAMSGFLQVRPKSEKIASQGEINRRARIELDKATQRLAHGDRDAKGGKDKPAGVDVVSGAEIAGQTIPFGTLLEFYPKKFTAKVGQKVTWSVSGHTVSFHVPKYLPIILIDKDGTVRFNPKTTDAINAPKAPEGSGGDEHGNGPPPPPVKIDAGNYDGSKFLSSGFADDELFSLTFTKPGAYLYACLVHPRMIGTVVVNR